ncbi:MAG: transposase [Euryarchaeota archaeon]|nr:transposase [Euryarchaeota archaeon]
MENENTARAIRARAIVAEKNAIQKVGEHTFAVKSQSGEGRYKIDNCSGWKCNCLDHEKRGVDCKHILATKYYLEIQKGSPEGTVTEKVRLTYSQAWTAYNAAQKEEVRLFDALLKDLVQAIPEPEQKMGRPHLPVREVLFCAVQKVYSQLSSRRAYSLFENAIERGQIAHVPSFNMPTILLNKPEITPLLHELIMRSAMPLESIETDFSVDSTGFRTTTFSAYNGEKHHIKRVNRWLKAHICAGVKTNIVTSIAITEENGADCPQFEPLMRKTAESFAIGEVSADKAYSSRDNLEAIDGMGGIAYIPFKKNATGKAKGSSIWHKMYHYFQLHREEFEAHYHKRSNVEATNAAIKRKFGETLKSKNFTAQVNELLAKIVAYNLTVIIHEMHENGVQPDFLHLNSTVCTESPTV